MFSCRYCTLHWIEASTLKLTVFSVQSTAPKTIVLLWNQAWKLQNIWNWKQAEKKSLQCYSHQTELQILLSFYFIKILDKTRKLLLWFTIQLHPIYLLCVLFYDSKKPPWIHHMDILWIYQTCELDRISKNKLYQWKIRQFQVRICLHFAV